ncbi:Wadjet anti-phage system protein JetA family protein [Alicyclobacillus herbarius]|uniref:Wadjet anti-phage system protein JetA family protein n=1 Tax=Alicyclobacillus herbarius TaxID=122960 RepID=UPI0004088101|nr:Wadjet anti-phage system protein JetA family protein [Alicyclobacillus herbarius]
MRDLFEVIPDNLFSVLAAPNRRVYFRALMVLRDCYQREVQFRRSDLVTYLISQMEDDLAMTSFADDEVTVGALADGAGALPPSTSVNAADGNGEAGVDGDDLDDTATVSGRAHALVRKLIDTGWVASITEANTFEETLIVPEYASILLDALHAIVDPPEQRYNAFVYSIYSTLRTAHEDRDEFMFQALQSAYDNTVALRESLRSLLHNIHLFYQKLQDRKEIRELLQEHFDEYQLGVALKVYHPLKTVDSVYRFRPRILQVLRAWLQDPDVLADMAKRLRLQRPEWDESEGRYEVVRMIQFIIDTFESIDDTLREIDRRNTAYSRASAERLQYLLNTDRDVKGKLIELLKALPPIDAAEDSPLLEEMRQLPLYQVQWVDADALYTEPTRRQRSRPRPLQVSQQVAEAAFAAEAEEMLERMDSIFSEARIVEFILRQMDEKGVLHTRALRLKEMEDFLRTMMALIKADEPEVPFDVEWDEENQAVVIGEYRIPAFAFVRTVNSQLPRRE